MAVIKVIQVDTGAIMKNSAMPESILHPLEGKKPTVFLSRLNAGFQTNEVELVAKARLCDMYPYALELLKMMSKFSENIVLMSDTEFDPVVKTVADFITNQFGIEIKYAKGRKLFDSKGLIHTEGVQSIHKDRETKKLYNSLKLQKKGDGSYEATVLLTTASEATKNGDLCDMHELVLIHNPQRRVIVDGGYRIEVPDLRFAILKLDEFSLKKAGII